jgi:hypothetical protein
MTERTPDDEQRLLKAIARYEAAGHAVQSGIAHAIELGWNGTTPKHMRTGIDLGKADLEGLATLLISKGLITEVEYHEAVADAVEREKARWQIFIAELMGVPPGKVTLG